MRSLVLTTASVIALGLGSVGLTYAAGDTVYNAGTAAGSNMPSATGTSQPTTPSMSGTSQSTMPSMTGTSQRQGKGVTASRSEIRELQQKLREAHLYRGKIDGRLGRETRHALQQYQKQNGLRVTATLDRETIDTLLGTGSVGQGSTNPPNSTNRMTPSTSPTPNQGGANSNYHPNTGK